MSNESFADLGVSNATCRALKQRGFDEPFAIQKKVIGDVLDGHDVLAKSPTGSGKTLAFMVPLVDVIEADGPRPAALVLAPTRELATQIVDETYAIAHARALKVTAVYGGVSLERQAREAAKSHIVVATPGRLEDLLSRGAFSLRQIEVLVLDEADRMLDMGFKPAVDRIVGQCPRDRQTLFFSATLDGEAGRIAKAFTHQARRHEHIPPVERKADIEHRFVRVERDQRVDRLVHELGDRWDLSLIFVRTKRGADRLVKQLKARGVESAAMHGDKSQRQRERALAAFEEGKVTTLVATDVAARGIHVDGIAKVINYDPPGQTEDYVHRVGRTGRAGERGIAVTLVAGAQVGDIRRMTRELKLEREFKDATSGPGDASGTATAADSERSGNGERPGRPHSRRGGRPQADGRPQGKSKPQGGGTRGGRSKDEGSRDDHTQGDRHDGRKSGSKNRSRRKPGDRSGAPHGSGSTPKGKARRRPRKGGQQNQPVAGKR